MKTLAIETSCDDTSIAIVSYDGETFSVDKILAYSQVKEHAVYGGVVPEIASRLHAEKIIPVLEQIGREEIKKVDFISVTTHPGLPGSLVVGKAAATLLGEYFNKEVLEVNHIQGHIFSLFLERSFGDIEFPLAILTVSGGHNDIYFVCKEGVPPARGEKLRGVLSTHHLAGYDIYKLGASIDDAAGEVYDKVARMMGGPYPGGFWMDTLTKGFEPGLGGFDHIDQKLGKGKFFKRIRLEKEEFQFSFSGLKSQVHNFIDKLKTKNIELTDELKRAIAYEFQCSLIEVLNTKLFNAAEQFGAQSVAICGGVSASMARRNQFQKIATKKGIPGYRPTKILYSTDNAAMIGLVGIMKKMDA